VIVNGIEVHPYDLSYDKIIKRTLDQSDGLTVRFINGLFGGDHPLDAKVEWLDKESVDDEYKALVADFYPRINGQMYSIEVEQDDNGDMALRVFKYALGGALRHNMSADDSQLKIVVPHPCVIFLKSGANTPKRLTWEIEFFDGQNVTLQVPSIRLAELSVDEIAQRDLFPVGQFYLRTFEPLTANKLDRFAETGRKLLTTLRELMEREIVPYHVAVEMEDTIRKTAENTIIKSKMEADVTMTSNILETLPWIDYREVFEKIEARSKAEGIAEGKAEGIAEGKAEGIAEGKAEGIAEGKAEGIAEGEIHGKNKRDMEIALNAFTKWATELNPPAIAENLKGLGISEGVIEAARKQVETERAHPSGMRSDPER
jgi:hypothetical protein